MRGAALAVGVAVILGVSAPAAATPGPSSAPEYWFDSWRVPTLWDGGARGQGVVIAEIDTGVNADLPELAGRVLKGKDFGLGGNGQVDREVDAFGHGTAMASIMVARPGLLDITGLAPDAKVLPIAVPLRGTTDADRPDRLPDAIRYAADHGAKIISMSVGGKRSPGLDDVPCSYDEQAAIYHALRKGALILASVGNSGPKRNTIEDPAVCLGVVAVGAVDATGHVAGFSTRQPYVTFVAPGVSVPSLGRVAGQAYSGDGTSQATAIASAVAALVWSKYPKLSAEQVVSRMLATLDSRRRTPSPAYGYGLLDAYRAVTAAVPADTANPVYSAVAPFLARDAALQRVDARTVPPPAVTRKRSTGTYIVGSAPRFTGSVVTGVVLAGAGLVLLALLLGLGVRGRRRRAAGAPAGYGLGVPFSETVWPPPPASPLATPPMSIGAPASESSAPDRPRPRPRPGPRPPGNDPG